MEKVLTSQIRNICLLGHGGSGKTALAEAMLYLSGNIDRIGNAADGNTVCDFDPEEIKRGNSIQLALAQFMWKTVKINLLDAPGFLGFEGERLEGIRAADASIIMVDGKAGIEVGTELAWERATEAGLPKMFFVNKFDDPECRFNRVFTQLHDTFGVSVCPLMIPRVEGDAVTGFINLVEQKVYVFDKAGKRTEEPIPEEFDEVTAKYREMLLEAVAGTSEELMEKYFAGEPLTKDEVLLGIHEGIIHGSIVPVMCGSAVKTWGVSSLLDIIEGSFPRHTAKKVEKAVDGTDIPIDKEGEDTAIFVFKTVSDPFVGKMIYFKVMTGTLDTTMTLKNLRTGAAEKTARIYNLQGKKQIPVDVLACGDIGMITKPVATGTGDTLVTNEEMATYAGISFPTPYMTVAVAPKAKGDEDKIAGGMAKLREEDQTIRFENNAETKQLLISGMGDMHLDIIVSRLKSRYNVSVDVKPQKIAYREAIRKTVQAEGKHKKQSGGHGQYGHVRITFSPGEEEGLTFTQSVVGGAVPKNFYPAVEKGLQEAMQKGVLAGYPMVSLKADLYDGSYHDVDSSEMAFKIAASLAYKDGLSRANPVLLEPVGELRVTVPEDLVGDVLGDLPKRRGSVMGMDADPAHPGYQIVTAEVPKSEMQDYTIVLRAMTQGKGRFTYEYTRYDQVPDAIAEKVIAEAKKENGEG